MIFLHDFLSCFSVMILYQSQTIFMFSHHVSRHVFLHVSLYVSRHDFLSNLSIKQSLCFFVMTFYHDFSSWLFFMTFLHDSFIMTFLSWLFFMTSIKKIMQKQKIEKISIFSSFDVKLKFLTSQVELIQFSVEFSYVKLKIWAIRLRLSWKCEQLDFESSWIQNVNSKLNSMISLFISLMLFLFILISRTRKRNFFSIYSSNSRNIWLWAESRERSREMIIIFSITDSESDAIKNEERLT